MRTDCERVCAEPLRPTMRHPPHRWAALVARWFWRGARVASPGRESGPTEGVISCGHFTVCGAAVGDHPGGVDPRGIDQGRPSHSRDPLRLLPRLDRDGSVHQPVHKLTCGDDQLDQLLTSIAFRRSTDFWRRRACGSARQGVRHRRVDGSPRSRRAPCSRRSPPSCSRATSRSTTSGTRCPTGRTGHRASSASPRRSPPTASPRSGSDGSPEVSPFRPKGGERIRARPRSDPPAWP